MTYDPADRISAEEALSHPWIASNSSVTIDAKAAENALSALQGFRADQKLK